MLNFKLPDSQDQELWLLLSKQPDRFLIRFNVYEQEIDLCGIYAGSHSLLSLFSEEATQAIEQQIYATLKQIDEEDRVIAQAA